MCSGCIPCSDWVRPIGAFPCISSILCEIRNPNVEIRNNIPILKIQMTKTIRKRCVRSERILFSLFETFKNSCFEFVSCFVLRISDLLLIQILFRPYNFKDPAIQVPSISPIWASLLHPIRAGGSKVLSFLPGFQHSKPDHRGVRL